jgi:site-specific recombinase XerD
MEKLRSVTSDELTAYSEAQPTLIEVPARDVDLAAEALALRQRVVPANTASAYRIAWDSFSSFCAERRYKRLPASPGAIAEYLTFLHSVRTVSLSTMKQHRAAIRRYHKLAGHLDPNRDPRVGDVWKGILMEVDRNEPQPTYAVWRRSVEAVVDALDAEKKRLGRFAPTAKRLALERDRALILLVASSARLTAAEISSLRSEEIIPSEDGLDVRVQRSRYAKPRLTTVRYRRGRYCPVEALLSWMRQAELTDEGVNLPVFTKIEWTGKLHGEALAREALLRIVKERCALAKIDPKLISMRALRSGSIIQGGYDGERLEEVLQSTGLSPESKPRVAALVARGRTVREKNENPPLGVDVIPVGVGRLVSRRR